MNRSRSHGTDGAGVQGGTRPRQQTGPLSRRGCDRAVISAALAAVGAVVERDGHLGRRLGTRIAGNGGE